MKKTIIFLGLAISLMLWNCSGNREKKESVGNYSSDSTSNAFISSSAAVETGRDSTRKFIRTADLKFKVKSVIKSTYYIEDVTKKYGGFVTFSNLNSNIDNSNIVAVSADSSLETTYFTVSNSITLRVPNTKLDTVLKEISRDIDYLDYRIIKAEDVALQIYANNLTQKRTSKNEKRMENAIENRGKKLEETTNAEELLLTKQEEADNARINNMSLDDQIKYSTINISIYQRQDLKRDLVSNDKNIDAYEPNFGLKILESLKSGWQILESFIVFLAKLWGLILFGIIVIFIYKRYWKKIKSKF